MTKGRPPGYPRLRWKKQVMRLALIAIVLIAVFWDGTVDIEFSRLFFGGDGSWPHADFVLWRLLYESDTYLTVALAAAALAFIVLGGIKARVRPFIRYGVFIILSASLGAGLIVNGILKQQWGRPRPDEIVEFGGDRAYMRPWVKGPRADGESFPSGHASIAFSYVVFWFIFRRRAGLATACLCASIVLGAAVGLGRIIQGRHFLSDVVWAAYITYIVCLIIYHAVLGRHPAANGAASRNA